LPGQSYTIFSSQTNYNNQFNLDIIDRLLFNLEQQGVIKSEEDTFKFIGIGYGGFILQSFVISAYGNFPKIGPILLLNSFMEIDSILKDTLLKSLEVFETCPEHMRELPYNYFSVIVNSQALAQD